MTCVGHTVNLFVVQAGAARLTLDSDPAMTRSLLQGMENAGRATLADLDRVLASLRADPSRRQPGRSHPGTGTGPAARARRTVPGLGCRRPAHLGSSPAVAA